MGLQGLQHCQMVVRNGGRGHHQGVLEEDGGCGGREQRWEEAEEEGGGGDQGQVWIGSGGVVGTGSKEVGGVKAAAGAEVTATLEHIADNVRDLLDRLVLEEKEKGKEKGVETDVEEMERGDGRGRGGRGVRGDRCGDGEGWRQGDGSGGDFEGDGEVSG